MSYVLFSLLFGIESLFFYLLIAYIEGRKQSVTFYFKGRSRTIYIVGIAGILALWSRSEILSIVLVSMAVLVQMWNLNAVVGKRI